ncbi:MAG: ROK family protein, partial [Clostridia bacterium]|nr:ROK family protein [Clostridia bacterium]
IENDANAAAYGEYIAGAGKGTENFVAVTLGTGVGGGVIINGKIYSGSNYAGAELGHTVINMDGEACTCGRKGCWEAYASATALIRQTKQEMIKYPQSVMWDMCEGDINKVSGRTAFDAMRKGDLAGKKVVDDYIKYVAVGISNNINIFQPEVICIGGGVSKEGDTLVIPIREYVSGENYARNVEKKTEIKTAALGNDAGIIGAAYLCNLYKVI